MSSFIRRDYTQSRDNSYAPAQHLVEYVCIHDWQERAAMTVCKDGVRITGTWEFLSAEDVVLVEEQVRRAAIQVVQLAQFPLMPLSEAEIDAVLQAVPPYERTGATEEEP